MMLAAVPAVYVPLAVSAYLIGMFPSASIVAAASGVDITKAGSGNPGASNVTRTLGWRKGLLVFVLDALKGALAAGVGWWLGGRSGGYVFGAAAILGHVFPVTRGLRGGKGVATGSGVIGALHPLVFPVILAVWWAVSKRTGKAALASIAAVVATPIGLAVTGAPAWEFAATVGLCVLLVARHSANISRLVHHQEPPLHASR